MRGEVLFFDEAAGQGLLSGDDGVRHDFRTGDLFHPFTPTVGDRVDFVATNGGASKIVLVERVRPSGQSPEDGGWSRRIPPAAPLLSPWGYFLRCSGSAYFQGEGRASRAEYWSFVLIKGAIFAAIILAVVAVSVATTPPRGEVSNAADIAVGLGMLLLGLLSFYWIVPGITALVRRLHDVGQTGWWLLIGMLPLVGPLILLVMTLQPSTGGPNAYGAPPASRREMAL